MSIFTKEQLRSLVEDNRRALGMEPQNEPRDDTDALTEALHIQSKHGNLILRHEIIINGIVYKPATYRLLHVGPAPAE